MLSNLLLTVLCHALDPLHSVDYGLDSD